MSWGNRILWVFIAFAGMISFMVYRCMQTPVNLVSDHYYKDELAYQDVIDGTRHANALTGKVEFLKGTDGIAVQLPLEMQAHIIKGTIFFYCPSDAGRDRRVPLNVDAGGRQAITAGLLLSGHYTVKLSWETDGVRYFNEQSITIQ
jgi:hypothetical protein